MLRLPLILAPGLTGRIINNEASKSTIMNKEFHYEKETLEKFQSLIDEKELNIKSIGDLNSNDLKALAIKLGIEDTSKTNEMLKVDLVNLSQIILGLFSIIIKYIYIYALSPLVVNSPI